MTDGDFWFQITYAFAALLLAFALGTVLIANIKSMIRLYQIQSVLLACIVLFTTVKAWHLPVLLAAAPPLLLAITVEFMLARATVPPQESGARQYFRLSYWRSLPPQAASIWLRYEPLRVGSGATLLMLALVAGTYLVAFRIEPVSQGIDQFSLVISLGLLLLGMLALGTQRNLIAQVMGLLVAEHGLFLAVVRLVPLPALTVFILSVFLYILLTLTILFVILPGLHRASGSIHVNDQRELRG